MFLGNENIPHSLNLMNYFFMTRHPHPPEVGLGNPPLSRLQNHTQTPHSVELLWTSDQPVAETCT